MYLLVFSYPRYCSDIALGKYQMSSPSVYQSSCSKVLRSARGRYRQQQSRLLMRGSNFFFYFWETELKSGRAPFRSIHQINFKLYNHAIFTPGDSELTIGMRILINQIQMQQQGWLRAEADQEGHIDEIHELAQRMKIAGLTLNEQLKRQEAVMDVLHSEMEATEGRLGDLQKQVGELLQTRDVNQVCTCLMLCCFMMVLIILIIVF